LRANGATALEECIHKAINLLDFVIDQSIGMSNLNKIEGKIESLNKILPVLASINNRVERLSYLKQLAEKLKIEEGILLQELRKVVETGKRRLDKPASMAGVPITSAIQVAERMLIQLIICYPSTRKSALSQLQANNFTSAVYAAIFKALQEEEHDVKEVDITALMSKLQDEETKAFVSLVAMEHEHFENVGRVTADCINSIKKNRLKTKLKDLQNRIKSTPDKQALQEYEQLVKTMKLGDLPASI
jgi:DNA primase